MLTLVCYLTRTWYWGLTSKLVPGFHSNMTYQELRRGHSQNRVFSRFKNLPRSCKKFTSTFRICDRLKIGQRCYVRRRTGVFMSIQERPNRKGKVFYSYSYTDPVTKQRVRLSKGETPRFTSREEAEEWGVSRDLAISPVKQAAVQRAAWKKTFKGWIKLLDEFGERKKETAPRSYIRVVKRIEKYVLPFFLGVKLETDASTWPLYFADYKIWLANQIQEKADRPLASYTQRHCINAYNDILHFLTVVKETSHKEYLVANCEIEDDASALDTQNSDSSDKNENMSNLCPSRSATGMRLDGSVAFPLVGGFV